MAKLKNGTKVFGDFFVNGAIGFTSSITLISPVTGEIEYDGTSYYATGTSTYGRGTIPLTLYTSGTGTSGINGGTNFPMFPAANDTITLPVGTYLVYVRFRASISGSTSTSTMQLNIRGGGTAVGSFSWGGTGAILDSGAASSFIVAATALGTAFSVTASSTGNPRQYIILGQGILKVTTSGTIIPSYSFTNTITGGTTTLVADNYMTIQTIDTQSAAAFGPSGSGWG
jgi:hypothetical protein